MSVRVLVVDDQEPFRLAAAAVIAATDGFELVGSVGSGEASVVAVDELQPDLVLMDMHLPGIDGPESARRIRALQPGVKVLLVSSSAAGDTDPVECGAIGYLAKWQLSPSRLSDLWTSQEPRLRPPA